VYVYVGDSTVLGIDDGRWKALSMQFTQGVIEDVIMKYGEGQIAVQRKANFFQAAELAGTGKTWPNGHAATVTFESGTDMSAVRLDYGSINTYVVRTLDPNCVAAVGSPCETAPAVYFDGMPPPAVVVFSGDAASTRFGIYVFAEEEYIKQVSVGFTHSDVNSWSISNTLTDMQVIHGFDAFGVYRFVGGSVPTGVSLTTVEAPMDGCMRACIDPEHINSNVESAHERGVLHDVVYVFGSDLQQYNPCETCGYVADGSDPASCASDGDACAAGGALCYADTPCVCDGVGEGGIPNDDWSGFAAACEPAGSAIAAFSLELVVTTTGTCKFSSYECFVGSAPCLPASCYVSNQSPSPPPSASPSPPPSTSPSPPPSASPSPPPSASPSPPFQRSFPSLPPSTSPSPPPSASNLYPGCSESDLLGDFNGNGYASA